MFIKEIKSWKTTPILSNLFHKTESYRILRNSFYEAIIALISKPDQDIQKKRKKKL